MRTLALGYESAERTSKHYKKRYLGLSLSTESRVRGKSSQLLGLVCFLVGCGGNGAVSNTLVASAWTRSSSELHRVCVQYSTVQYSMVRTGNVTRGLGQWGVRMGERPARCMMIPHCANELRAVRDAACKTAIEQNGDVMWT